MKTKNYKISENKVNKLSVNLTYFLDHINNDEIAMEKYNQIWKIIDGLKEG